MKILKEIKDQELPEDKSKLKIRQAVRAILFDENNLIPLLFVAQHNYHKIPGGGILKGEDKVKALRRECREEVGCEIEIIGEIGKIIEFRSKWDLMQTSYCYFGKIKSKGLPSFTKKELSQDFRIIWVTLEDAIEKAKNDQPSNYEGLFIRERDLEFLKNLF